MRLHPAHSDVVPALPECTGDDADRHAGVLEHRPLLDVRLEVGGEARRTFGYGRRRRAGLADRLHDLGPGQVLRRGYAVVRNEAGGVVRDPAALSPGQLLEVEVAAGCFTAAVEAVFGG